MFNFKKKSHVSIELNDYVLRALVKKGPNAAQWILHEIPLPKGVVQDATIIDEIALFNLLKENASKFGGKKQNVRLFVPDTSVLLKTFDHPPDVEGKKLKEYVQMELGHSIHLPFQEPLLDVYDHIPGDGQAVLFAAPPEEVQKFMGLLLDIHMNPEVADIRALSNLRLLEQMKKIDDHKTFLIADWSINELSICIYTNGHVEFLRYQSIDTDMVKWNPKVHENGEVEFTYSGDIQDYRMIVTDQVLELDRMMNFFKFSLHKGEKSVDEIIIMGDNPLLDSISTFLSENLATPIKVIDDAVIEEFYPQLKAKHASLIGLALKEVNA
ncbi:type IV pilus biogenesis protein PilM [Solibacillus sp. FSL H8-0538]|uniref:type IV pilus biogenesis protein PilM n=1 Tax=Solibacillus sp. FSL H8-0538 TaxID=2921400 RepID=UPI0030FA3E4F